MLASMDNENTLWYEMVINKILQDNDDPELATQLWEKSEEKTETSSNEISA